MSILERMTQLITQLESGDNEFLESLDKEFLEFQKDYFDKEIYKLNYSFKSNAPVKKNMEGKRTHTQNHPHKQYDMNRISISNKDKLNDFLSFVA